MKQVSRFLIIDDDAGNNILCEILIKKTLGANDIKTFTEPVVAVDYVKSEYMHDHAVPTVIFLDINMPVLTGWDVLEKFEALNDIAKEHLSVYLVSSSIDQRDIERANKNPLVTEYIEKPLTAQKLREIAMKTASPVHSV